MGCAALSVLACCVLQLTVGARHTTGQVMLSSSTAAVSERDCSCVCTLRRPSLEQCMLDRAPPSPKPLPAPGSKCRCQCEVTGFNPCETELRLEKLRRRSTDIDKVQGISVMLRQALENADIRRLSSNTNRVSTHLKTLEQALRSSQTAEKVFLKKLQSSLTQNAMLYHNYSEAMRSLSRELYKLNAHLRSLQATQGRHTGDQNLCNITLEQDRGAKVKEQAGAGKEHSSPSLSPSPALNHTTTSSRSEETRQTDRQGELSNTVCEDGCSGSLSAVSPPLRRSVFGRSGEGAWFSDPLSQDSPLYVAPLLFGSTLLEFRDMDVLARGEPLSPPHTLPASYSGSGHTVYNSSFYYLKAFTRTLIRYSLVQRCLCAWSELSELPSPSHGHGWQGHNEVTLGADEGGLWVAYPSLLEGELLLRRLDSEELLPRRGEGGEKAAWSTGLGRHRYGLCFLVCGVLYVLERGAESEGVVFHAFDSHTGSHTSPALPFPARPATTLLTQLSYNPRDRLLYGWDDGALLTYSLEFTC
ncbi:olfactomedin-like protein 2A isoform X1 [Huso huso]|uniref:Olfactomedin-like protein 2A isoform X1 n=1 Tax=Huso huso TaxID=61971 RepID=A0ABR0YAW8_HUSHU